MAVSPHPAAPRLPIVPFPHPFHNRFQFRTATKLLRMGDVCLYTWVLQGRQIRHNPYVQGGPLSLSKVTKEEIEIGGSDSALSTLPTATLASPPPVPAPPAPSFHPLNCPPLSTSPGPRQQPAGLKPGYLEARKMSNPSWHSN